MKRIRSEASGTAPEGPAGSRRGCEVPATGQSDESLRASEQKFRLMANAAPVMIWMSGADRLGTWFNKQWLDFVGRTLEQELGHGWLENVHPDDLAGCVAGIGAAFDARRPFSIEFRLRRHDGLYRWLLNRGILLPSTDGRFAGYIGSCVDITERKETEQALCASEERYRALVESHAEMLCRFRPDGTILFVNNAYAKSIGTTTEALAGGNFWIFVSEADRPRVKAMLHSLTPESPVVTIENRFETAEGERWVLWTNRALAFDNEGRLLEAQSAGTDITRRKQMEQALQEADRRKDEFLATLAHELRNPLAPIANSLEILRQAEGNVDLLRTARDAIERQVSHLVRLVDDLLDVSRITRDRLELRKSLVELRPAVLHALESLRLMVESAGQSVEVSLPDEPLHLEADPVRLAQILTNLLNNACKYTGRGGWIRIAAERRQDEVVITVKDSGIGMPQDKLETIFEMFSQVGGARGPSSGGLGIGLTLVKRLVELHGGTITARSEGPGHGSEFVLILPVSGSQPAPEAAARGRIAALDAGRRILVVDDNEDSADSLATLLQLRGNETQVAYDGLSGVQAAERFRPDVVLLDLGLPVLGGLEACRRLRGEAWGETMLIVALTGWGQAEDREKSKEAGFDLHLVKPVEYSQLAQLLADAAKVP